MATGKRYYWVKLYESLMTSDTVGYFMGLPGGANYVVLYQMLGLMTKNTGGRLLRRVGQIDIPYDVEKIRQDCKYFSTDTIRVALNLYRQFGLIAEGADGVLYIVDHERMVGSETDWALQKSNQRSQKAVTVPVDKGVDNVHSADNGVDKGVDNVHTNNTLSLNLNNNNYGADNVHTEIDNRYIDNTIYLSGAGARENKINNIDNAEDESDDEEMAELRSRQLRRFGALGNVMLSDEQVGSLLEKLSLEEFNRYLKVIDGCEAKGHKFGKTHYRVMLDMAEKDRRVKR